MSKWEITNKFDEILSFSEVEKFIDTPVKFYSSGMKMRLAFAIAAHLEPEILIVDEVLAVGDVAFQKKCIQKMGEAGMKGRTVLFVSHNMSAVSNLCDRVIFLKNGEIHEDGPALEVITNYLAKDSDHSDDGLLPDDNKGGFGLVRPPHDLYFPCGDVVSFSFEVVCPKAFRNATVVIILHDVFENPVVGAASRMQGQHGEGTATHWGFKCDMGNIPLNCGSYNVTIRFGNEDRNYATFSKAMALNILPSSVGNIPKKWGNFFWKPLWQIEALDEERVTSE
jgi:lipopolysaccharide transport system ATP-binding protein